MPTTHGKEETSTKNRAKDTKSDDKRKPLNSSPLRLEHNKSQPSNLKVFLRKFSVLGSKRRVSQLPDFRIEVIIVAQHSRTMLVSVVRHENLAGRRDMHSNSWLGR